MEREAVKLLKKTKQMASLFGLSEHLNKYPYQLSGDTSSVVPVHEH